MERDENPPYCPRTIHIFCGIPPSKVLFVPTATAAPTLLFVFDNILEVVVVAKDLDKGCEGNSRYLWVLSIHFRPYGVSFSSGSGFGFTKSDATMSFIVEHFNSALVGGNKKGIKQLQVK